MTAGRGLWATQVDAILCGHTLAAWSGQLHGTPAGHAFPLAAGVLGVDLLGSPSAHVHPPSLVPAIEPLPGPAIQAIEAAGEQMVAEVADTWMSHPDAEHYLPRLIAGALRQSSGAEAGLIPPNHLFTQAPVDGVVAALAAGKVSELDVWRLFPFPADGIAVPELRPGEFRRIIEHHDREADPATTTADTAWWNWAQLPSGWSSPTEEPETLAVMAFAVPFFEALLGREVIARVASAGARGALLDHLDA